MNYQTFLTNLREQLEQIFGEDYSVQIRTITKNNDNQYDSIIIFDDKNSVSPTIYLQEFYESYCNGTSLEDIAGKISALYFSALEDSKHLALPHPDELSFSQYENRIIYRLINYEKNELLLQSQPHIRFLDLAITFYCLISQDDHGIRSMRITNSIMEHWKMNTRQLFKLASHNTPKLFPLKLSTMHDIMIDMLQNEGISTRLLEDTPDTDSTDKHMYVLTNHIGINGATALLYKDVAKNIASNLNSDFYILPSSIHELILVPYHSNLCKDELLQMVSDVNQTLVAPEDILSDQVYIYRMESNSFEM